MIPIEYTGSCYPFSVATCLDELIPELGVSTLLSCPGFGGLLEYDSKLILSSLDTPCAKPVLRTGICFVPSILTASRDGS